MRSFEINEKTLIVLPHLDDEFALAPLIRNLKKKDKKNLTFIFCAERINSPKKRILKRRKENKLAMKYLGIRSNQIIYLNDFFLVEDLSLYKSKENIIKFLKSKKFNFIITLACEGGNPDHDYLAVLIYKLSKEKNFKPYYFPAYNYENFLFFPYKIIDALSSERNFYKEIIIGYFCWIDSIVIALIYNSEFFTFIKMIPHLINKLITSNSIFYTDKINLERINWNKSLVNRIYRFDYRIIQNEFYD